MIPRHDAFQRDPEPEAPPARSQHAEKRVEGEAVSAHGLGEHTGTPSDIGAAAGDHTHPLTTATDNVASPPTDAELDTAFGQPSGLGDGFTGLLDDNGAGTTVWLCYVINNAWWYEQLTKAT